MGRQLGWAVYSGSEEGFVNKHGSEVEKQIQWVKFGLLQRRWHGSMGPVFSHPHTSFPPANTKPTERQVMEKTAPKLHCYYYFYC